jgi:phytoene/squalene synthetase
MSVADGPDAAIDPAAEAGVRDAHSDAWADSTAWRLLPEAARADVAVLFRYLAALRAIADHPALAPERKEAALAAVAAALEGRAAMAGAAGGTGNAGVEAARSLASRLEARGIDLRPARLILQAAEQDLRKARYRDWSELLAWCRFGAGPAAALAVGLAGGDSDPAEKAESTGIALQLIDCVGRAGLHYRWLGRVYLPERWFAEAGARIEDLGRPRADSALMAVFRRALDQAGTLLADGGGAAASLPGFRLRAAAFAALAGARREARALARGDPLAGPRPSGRGGHLAAAAAILRAGLRR